MHPRRLSIAIAILATGLAMFYDSVSHRYIDYLLGRSDSRCCEDQPLDAEHLKSLRVSRAWSNLTRTR